MIEDRGAGYRQEKQKREEAEAENARLRQEAEQRQQVIAQQPDYSQASGFDNERYYTLLNDQPLEATKYALRAMFGVEDPVAAFNAMREESWSVVKQNVTTAFLATHPDFNPADTAALSGRVQACLAYGMPFSAQTVDYAYQTLKQDGTAKPLELAPPEPDPVPPPSLSGSGAGTGMVDAERMSDKDLEALLRSNEMLR